MRGISVATASAVFAGMVLILSLASRAADDAGQQKRVRELIYILRQHRVFERCDEWAGAIRELVQIGKPAVPELVAELDRTERNQTLRALGFTLRAIDDKRAIPALIRAIPKTFRDGGSGCGVTARDPELNAFMRKHQNHPTNDQDESDKSFTYGRPVNEIRTALFKLTKHEKWPKENEEIPRVWREWWSKHGAEFVTAEELKSVELPKRDRDLVEEDGVARFGPIFPTGKDVILGPVYEIELMLEYYRNAPSYFDFDTGRMLQYFEGFRGCGETSGFGRRHADWIADTGVDLRYTDRLEGNDLHVWMIENSRWETIEVETHSGKPFDLGREAHNYLIPFGADNTDFLDNEMGTFLFTTREGGRVIVQVEPKEEFSAVRKMRYRLWNDKGDRAPHAAARTGKQDESQWEPVKELTLQGPGRGRAFLFDLETGKTVAPPDSEVPADAPLSFSFTDKKNTSFADWCRKQGIDFAAHEVRLYGANNTKAVKGNPNTALRVLNIVGLDLTDIRVTPDAFDDMTGEEVRELVTRWQASSRHAYLYMTFSLPLPPDTFVFVTNSGTIGLLQYRNVKSDLSGVTVRYKLLKKRSE